MEFILYNEKGRKQQFFHGYCNLHTRSGLLQFEHKIKAAAIFNRIFCVKIAAALILCENCSSPVFALKLQPP